MANTIYDTYLEAEVFGADPVKLVHMLYRAAIESVGAARRHLAAGAIRDRSRQITKTWSILYELLRALDMSQGEISRRLAELYGYMQHRLLEANARQQDAPLAEVEKLLNILCEAWEPRKPAQTASEEIYQPLSCSA